MVKINMTEHEESPLFQNEAVGEYLGRDQYGRKQRLQLFLTERKEQGLEGAIVEKFDLLSDGEKIGDRTMILFPEHHLIRLHELYIQPPFRGQGLGRASLKALISYLNQRVEDFKKPGDLSTAWTVEAIPVDEVGFSETVFKKYFQASWDSERKTVLTGTLPTAKQLTDFETEEHSSKLDIAA
jgi:GNAT superfamily N-acetyltransferase